MPYLYPLARPLFGLMRPEHARDLTIDFLERGLGGLMVKKSAHRKDASVLTQRLWGLHFPNPIGLAAGFDKDARVPDEILANWHFGFVEVGTVTPQPQVGNQKPRVFRLREDHAIINRMGFNSRGLDFVQDRLRARNEKEGIVGLNLGKNRDTQDAFRDYETCIQRTANLVDYLVVNVSSPNTPGLRDLQRRAPLHELLSGLIATRNNVNPKVPLLVKIAPDLSLEEAEDIASVAQDCPIDGIVIANTTTERPSLLRSGARREQGGLSGKPLFEKSTRLIAQIYRSVGPQIPIIGVGGISTANDAYEKICAGASLVQIYTALAFHGPMLVSYLKWGLANLLTANGFYSVSEAIGTQSEKWLNGRPAFSATSIGLNGKTVRKSKPYGLSPTARPLTTT